MILWSLAISLTGAHAATYELAPGSELDTILGALQPGDEAILSGGSYSLDSVINISVVGTEDKPVSIRAAATQNPVLVADPEGAWAVVSISESAWLSIEGITFKNGDGYEESGRTGVYIDGCDDCSFTDNVVEEIGGSALVVRDASRMTITGNELASSTAGSGMYLGCSDASCWVQNSDISLNWIHDLPDSGDYGIYMGPGGQGNLVAHNNLHDIAGTGILVHSTEYGDLNEVDANCIFRARQGLVVQGTSRVRNNLIFDIDEEGIIIDDPDRDTFEGVVVTHNTVARSGEWAAEINDWYASDDMVFANNALSNPTGYGLDVNLAETVADTAIPPIGALFNNVVSGLVDGVEGNDDAVIYGGGFGDFSDADANDFYPITGSELVNAGSSESGAYVPSTDFIGQDREGDEPDAGAYEWFGDGNPGWIPTEGFKSLEIEDTIDAEVGGCDCGGGASSGDTAWVLLPFGLFPLLRRRRTA